LNVQRQFIGLFFAIASNCVLVAHEGHQPLPTKGVQVDTERGYITLSGQARNAIGLETTEVAIGDVSSQQTAYAEAVAPWNAKAFGSAQISGRITKLFVRPGDAVSKGQVVAELSSRELDSLQLEFSQAKKELALNKQLLELTKPSATSGAVPMQRLLDLENAYQQSENSLAIARIRARVLGVDVDALENDSNQSIRHLIRSPIAGKVIHSDLSEVKFVEAFEHLFEIVNNDETWVRLQLLEKDIFNVKIGQVVDLEFVDSSIRTRASIDRIDAGLEPRTQISWAWVTVSDPAVVPGLVGSATIYTTTASERLAVPLRSIYSDGLQAYVFVEEASTRTSAEYKKRNIVVGKRRLATNSTISDRPASATSAGGEESRTVNNDLVEILQGDIYPGDRVVVKGGHELSSLFFLGVLKLSAADRSRLGIETFTATNQSISNAVELAATVTLPPESRSVTSSQLAGTIHSHQLTPGKDIRSGDLLMEIASPEFYALQLDLLRTSLDANLSRDRAKRLEEISGDAFSRRMFLETLAKADQLENRVGNLKRQLVSLGLQSDEVDTVIREKQIRDYLPIRASINGRLVSWVGTLGETVVANQSLVEIQNLVNVWIEAHVPTKQMGRVSLRSHGQAVVLSNQSVAFPVSVTRIGPIVSETTRTQRIWLQLDQQREQAAQIDLRDGMQLTVLLKSSDGQQGLVVPASAVLRDGLHAFVFVQKPDDYVERRRVTTGRSDGEFVEILTGVVAGEAVVSAGGRDLQTAFASLR
jgi:RND family efflux transporter MFP subunit